MNGITMSICLIQKPGCLLSESPPYTEIKASTSASLDQLRLCVRNLYSLRIVVARMSRCLSSFQQTQRGLLLCLSFHPVPLVEESHQHDPAPDPSLPDASPQSIVKVSVCWKDRVLYIPLEDRRSYKWYARLLSMRIQDSISSRYLPWRQGGGSTIEYLPGIGH